MSNQNPYESPEQSAPQLSSTRRLSKMVGAGVLLVGLFVLAYGAIAFWLVNSLPPNGGVNGRLPSLYVMGGGIVITVIGLALRSLGGQETNTKSSSTAKTGVPTSLGLFLLLAIMIIFIVIVSQM